MLLHISKGKILITCLISSLAVLFVGCSNNSVKQASAGQSVANKNLIVAMTTSIEDSGLLDD